MAIKLILNTLGTGTKVKSIYTVDALVEFAIGLGREEVVIAEPSNELLEQLQALRPDYQLFFDLTK